MKRALCILLILFLPPAHACAAKSALAQGSQGAAVQALQQRLTDLGLSAGKLDGNYGAQTASAVKEAQRLLSLAGYDVEVTGKADAQTLALLDEPAAEPALRTLCRGSRGSRVRELQDRLIDLDLLHEMSDGAFGANTEEAVIAFQHRMTELGVEGLQADGIVTPDVHELLMEDLSEYGYRAPIYFDDTEPLSLSPQELYATSYILMDAPTGKVLCENNADVQRYPASTTKILTLLLALRHGNLDEVYKVPECAADIPSDSSRVPISPGEKLSMRDLLYGLMIRSGNDAANAIADICSGSVDAFVQEMNAYAQELGMTNSHFANPHGYHDEAHYSTARDLAIAARAGLTDPTFCQIVTCLNYTLPATGKREPLTLQNTYEIFDPATDFYIEGAAGVKSGYTSHAGFCYVGAAQREGRTLIAVILNVPGRDRGWMDLKRLFEYGFALPY